MTATMRAVPTMDEKRRRAYEAAKQRGLIAEPWEAKFKWEGFVCGNPKCVCCGTDIDWAEVEERRKQVAQAERQRKPRKPVERPVSVSVKHCVKCDTTKPASEFNRQSASGDGLQRWCRECGTAYQREKYAEDPEKEKLRARRKYAKILGLT